MRSLTASLDAPASSNRCTGSSQSSRMLYTVDTPRHRQPHKIHYGTACLEQVVRRRFKTYAGHRPMSGTCRHCLIRCASRRHGLVQCALSWYTEGSLCL